MFRFMLVMVLLSLSMIPLGGVQPDSAFAQIGGCPAIEFGQTQTGTIDNTNPRTTYCILAEAGDSLNITLSATSGDLDTYLILEMGDGTTSTVVAENDDISEGNVNSAIQYTAPSTAVYFIVATRYEFENGVSSGGYVLTLNASGNSGGNTGGATTGDRDDDGYDDTVDGCPDTFGGEPDGCPRPDSDSDGYNDNIDLCPFDVGGEPDGCPADNGQPNSSNPNQNCAEADGLGYEITEIISDQQVTGYIDSPMVIVYCFYGNEGNVPYMQMNAVAGTGDLDPILSLLDEAGNLLFRNDNMEDCNGCKTAAINYVLPGDGVYYIRLEANNSVGNYTLDFQLTNQFMRACDSYIANDYSFNDTLNNEKTSFLYCFNGKVGDTIKVAMTARSGNLAPYLSLTEASDPQGFVIAESNEGYSGSAPADSYIEQADAYLEFVLPSTGVFYVWATRDEGLYGQTDQTTNRTSGDFNFFFLLDPAPDSTTSGGSGGNATGIQDGNCDEIADGMLVNRTLSVESPASYFCFYGDAGETVQISMFGISADLDTYLRLQSANGDIIAENDDNGESTDSKLIFTLPSAGMYYIEATSYGHLFEGTVNGDVQLLFTRDANNIGSNGGGNTGGNANNGGNSGGNEAATAIQNEGCVEISANTPINQAITSSEQAWYYCFYGYAGDTIQIELFATSGDLDTYLTVFNIEGELVAENDDNGESTDSWVSFIVSQNGIYYVEATSYGYLFEGPTYGNFELVLTK